MLRRVTLLALAPWTLVTGVRDIGIGLRALTAAGGPLDRIADVSETLERLAALDETLRELPESVRAIEGLVGGLQPSLAELQVAIAELQVTIGTLGTSLTPIGRLADRVPGARNRR
jgi:hypothetical protein